MFFYILIIIVIIVLLLLLSTIKVELKNIRISKDKKSEKKIKEKNKIKITLNILKLIPIFRIKVENDKIKNFNLKKITTRIDINNLKSIKNEIDTINKIRKYKPQIDKLNLYIEIGVEDAIISSYLVAIISSIIGIILRKQFEKPNNKFIIKPIYKNKNCININLDSTFTIKVIHIIYIMYIIKAKVMTKN